MAFIRVNERSEDCFIGAFLFQEKVFTLNLVFSGLISFQVRFMSIVKIKAKLIIEQPKCKNLKKNVINYLFRKWIVISDFLGGIKVCLFIQFSPVGLNFQKSVNHTRRISKVEIFVNKKQTRLLVSGRSPECSDCPLRFMEQQ